MLFAVVSNVVYRPTRLCSDNAWFWWSVIFTSCIFSRAASCSAGIVIDIVELKLAGSHAHEPSHRCAGPASMTACCRRRVAALLSIAYLREWLVLTCTNYDDDDRCMAGDCLHLYDRWSCTLSARWDNIVIICKLNHSKLKIEIKLKFKGWLICMHVCMYVCGFISRNPYSLTLQIWYVFKNTQNLPTRFIAFIIP